MEFDQTIIPKSLFKSHH